MHKGVPLPSRQSHSPTVNSPFTHLSNPLPKNLSEEGHKQQPGRKNRLLLNGALQAESSRSCNQGLSNGSED